MVGVTVAISYRQPQRVGEGYGLELLVYVYTVSVYVVNGWEWLEEP
jgi:hypothetical protein